MPTPEDEAAELEKLKGDPRFSKFKKLMDVVLQEKEAETNAKKKAEDEKMAKENSFAGALGSLLDDLFGTPTDDKK